MMSHLLVLKSVMEYSFKISPYTLLRIVSNIFYHRFPTSNAAGASLLGLYHRNLLFSPF